MRTIMEVALVFKMRTQSVIKKERYVNEVGFLTPVEEKEHMGWVLRHPPNPRKGESPLSMV